MEIVKYKIWDTVEIASKDAESSSMNKMTLIEIDEHFQMVLQRTSDDIYNSQCRKEPDQDTGIPCMDFAENYSFIAQNSIQELYLNDV